MPALTQLRTASMHLFCSALFWVMLVVLLACRVYIYVNVNLQYIDSDQFFMWMGARDFANGLFAEPRFYGQNYNTFLEALVAAPLLLCGVPVQYAVPAATHLLFLTPVLFTALYLYFSKRLSGALLFLAVFLSLTPLFLVLTAIPRGFVTGIFFCSFSILSLMHPGNRRYAALNLAAFAIGFFVNPNSILISAPVFLYLALHNFRERWFYRLLGFNLLLAGALYLLLDLFYMRHPDYVVYGLVNDFSPTYFLQNLEDLDTVFAHISFIRSHRSLGVLFVLALLMVLAYRRRQYYLFASLAFFCGLLLLACFAGKTRDGADWVFYSHSRAFIGVPVFMALCLTLLRVRHLTATLISILSIVICSFSVRKPEVIASLLDEKKWAGVHLVKLDVVKWNAAQYRDFCKKHKVDYLLVSSAFWLNTAMVNGGPALFEDFPRTQDTKAERRYWVREQNATQVPDSFIFLSGAFQPDSLLINPNFKIEPLDGWGLFLIRDNKLPLKDFIRLTRNS